MSVVIRDARADDAVRAGEICYNAFYGISTAHNFPPDFPSPDVAIGLIKMAIEHPEIYGVIAEADGEVAGSNFLWEQSDIAGVGPITVASVEQNRHVGRQLMEAVLRRAEAKHWKGVRLCQAAFHGRSLSLYTKLGFDTREPLSNMQGAALNKTIPGRNVRKANADDAAACNALCARVHGHDRRGEVRDGRAHAAAETNDDMKALIAAAPEFPGPGFLLPTRNGDLMRWCLDEGLRVVQPMTLMSKGFYQEPKGAFLPSVLF
jgi:GNAT superfamily N-acetyltransferase